MGIRTTIEWNRETRRLEVVSVYDPDEPIEAWEPARRPAHLGAYLAVTAAVATTVPTSAWSATASSIYQQASDAERVTINGAGVRVFHYDGGINPLSFTDPHVVDAMGDYPDMSAYKDNVFKVDGRYVGLYDDSSAEGIGYGDLTRRDNHGPWMNYTLLQQAPGVTLLTGYPSYWAEAFAVASDPNGYHARVMSASELVWYGTLQPSERSALDKVVANDGLMFIAAGNDSTWTDPVPVAMAPSTDVKYFGHVIPVTGTDQNTGEFASNLTGCHDTKYYCVAAPQGYLLRDANGNPMRLANGRYAYSGGAGTSYSAPNADAITAEVVQRYPWMTARNLTEVILGTADDIVSPTVPAGIDDYTGWGEIDRDAAVGGYKQFAWGQSKLAIPAGQTAYFDNNIGDDRADAVTTGIYNNDAATLGNVSTTLAGGFDKSGAGTLVLNGDNTYHGRGNVLEGRVVVNGLNNNAAFVVAQGAILQSGDNSAGMSVGSLDNAGTLALQHMDTTLDVMGDYTGRDLSSLLVNAYLGDETTTRTPVLHIHGDSQGTSLISVSNAGGPGGLIAATPSSEDGHLLVQIDGVSGATLVQDGRIVAGAYDYFVRKGAATRVTAAGNWYLSSALTPVAPTPTPTPTPANPVTDPSGTTATATPPPSTTPTPTPTPTPPAVGDTGGVPASVPSVNPSTVTTPPAAVVQAVRPEGSIYLAQAVAARDMFQNGRWLGNRLIGATPEGWAMRSSLWMISQHDDRHYGVSNNSGAVNAQNNVMQIGVGSLIGDHVALGVRGGMGHTNMSTRSPTTGYVANGRTKGTQLGVYADYRDDPEGLSGLSATAELSGGRFQNQVRGQGLPWENYRLQATDLTMETAYDSRLAVSQTSAIVFRPHLAVVQGRTQRKEHTEQGGTRVDFDSRPYTEVLAGLQVAADLQMKHGASWTPYVGFDRIRNDRSPEVGMDGTDLATRALRNVSRYSIGTDARFVNGLQLRLDVRHERSAQGLRDNVAQVSLAIPF